LKLNAAGRIDLSTFYVIIEPFLEYIVLLGSSLRRKSFLIIHPFRLGRLMYLLLSGGYLLFRGDTPKEITVRILGRLPDRFWNKWNERTVF